MKNEELIPRSPVNVYCNVPTVVQMEAIECGAACLGSICGYFGRFISLDVLRKDCQVSRDGVSVMGILQASEKQGLLAEPHSVELEQLYEMPLPLIAHWNMNHFVVIEGFSDNVVYIMDPSLGKMKITYEELNRSFSGVVIIFDLTLDFQQTGKPPGIFNALVNAFHIEQSGFIFAFLAGVGLVITQLAIPAIGQFFIDDILTVNLFNWTQALIYSICLIIFLIFILKYLEMTILSRLYIKLTTQYSANFLWHILRLPYEFYLHRFTGDIGNRLQINENVYKTLATKLAPLVIDSTVAVLFALALFYYDSLLACVTLLMTGIEALILVYFFRSRRNAYFYYLQTYSKSMGYSINLLLNIETVKAQCLDYEIFSRWAGLYTKSLNATQEIGKRDAMAGTLAGFIPALTQILVLTIGAYKVMQGSMSVGMVFAASILAGFLTDPITRLIDYMQQLQFLKIDIERLNDVLKHPIDKMIVNAENEEDKLQSLMTVPKLSGSIDISKLTFSYFENRRPLIKNFSLHLAPGSMVGLVGSSGSGKSTLLKLIGGLLEPSEGTILFDKKTRSDLPRSLLMNSVGVVEQNALPFFGTIKDNISSFNPLIEQDDIIKAAKDACLHEEILLRKGGYDLMLHNSGSNLSGGQSQRLEIARALAANPTILLLDEATSALDSVLEKKVMENIRRRGCTCLLVAHRIASTRLCDEIIVLDNGKIVEKGRPEDLIESNGLYKHLYDLEQLDYAN